VREEKKLFRFSLTLKRLLITSNTDYELFKVKVNDFSPQQFSDVTLSGFDSIILIHAVTLQHFLMHPRSTKQLYF
jgi:hypothetical protein